MTPTLTEQQRRALREAEGAGPVTVVDPATSAEYVLIRADVFRELEWMRDLDPRDAYPLVDRIMAEDDAVDPTLASYQDPRLSGDLS